MKKQVRFAFCGNEAAILFILHPPSLKKEDALAGVLSEN
jgi:hypothetical protein